MFEPSFTLKDLLAHPSGDLFVRQAAIRDEDSLADFAEFEIHDAIQIIEENPQYAQGCSEDQITNMLVVALRSKGLQADHDTKIGGHADIVIRHKRLKWVAEAKIFDGRGYRWLMRGLLQLTTRYMPARMRRGALIVYTFQINPVDIMNELRRRLVGTRRVVDNADCSYCPMSFYVELTHPRSGLTTQIRHTIVCLNFSPQA